MAEPIEPQESTEPTDTADLPQPELRRHRRLTPSLIWLVPLISALAGIALVIRALLLSGPTITITFNNADGLEENKTEVRYKNVIMGKVRQIELADDRKHVAVKVKLVKSAAALVVEDTRFWVVRARADLGGISGLSTILSGSYIGMDAGKSSESRREFEGLDVPPAVTNDQQGRRFELAAEDLGSLSLGSPLYFRRLPVGRIVGFDLDPAGQGIKLQAFVDEPYAKFVTANAHFYNASGIDVSIGPNGLKLNTQSLVSLATGGVAFELPPDLPPGPPAPADAHFKLYPDRSSALAPPDGTPLAIRMRFYQSVRGLGVDAPIDFAGLELGKVKAVALDYDEGRKIFFANVDAEIFPARLGGTLSKVRRAEGNEETVAASLNRLIGRGLRAQLRVGNLLTGQLYVALDFLPKEKANPMNSGGANSTLEIPTVTSSFDQIQTQLADIVRKIDQVPFGQIGANLRDTLAGASALLKQLDTQLAPEAKQTLEQAQRTLQALDSSLASPDAPLQQNAQHTLEELSRTARALRHLADYLQRHPESLLRGKTEAAAPEENH